VRDRQTSEAKSTIKGIGGFIGDPTEIYLKRGQILRGMSEVSGLGDPSNHEKRGVHFKTTPVVRGARIKS